MARSFKKLIAAVFCLVLLFELSSCAVNTKSAEQTGFSMGSLVGIKLYGKTRQNTAAISFFNDLAKLVSPHKDVYKRQHCRYPYQEKYSACPLRESESDLKALALLAWETQSYQILLV